MGLFRFWRRRPAQPQPIVDDMQRIVDRVEEDGVAIAELKDGFLFGFTRAQLVRMIDDIDARPDGRERIYLFVRTPADAKA